MAGLGIKLTPEETADAFKGIKLTPGELKGHSYAPPREHSDKELGLETGLQGSSSVGPFSWPTAKSYADMSVAEKQHMNDVLAGYNEAVRSNMAAAGLGAVGGGVLAGALGKAAPKAAPALTGTMAEMRAASPLAEKASKSLAEKMMTAIGNTAHHSVTGAALDTVGQHFKPVITDALKAGVGLAKGAGNAAVAAVPAVATGAAIASAPVTTSPMFNMVDRLRTSSSPRAAELYAKIQALKSPDLAGAGTGEVTQGPAGAMP